MNTTTGTGHAGTINRRKKELLCDCGLLFHLTPTPGDPHYCPDWEAHVKEARAMGSMHAQLMHRGRTQKEVLVEGITNQTDEQITDAALTATHETRERLFGISVSRGTEDPSRAMVILYTD